jgi:tRNA(adenine34) deaminase
MNRFGDTCVASSSEHEMPPHSFTSRSLKMHPSSLDHELHLQNAIAVSRQNPQAPFGCVLVDRRTGKIVATGVNQSAANPTLHGEMAAINDYARQDLSDWDQLTLYTTAEPCCMCQAAILWAGIREVVFGTSIEQLKAFGWKQFDIAAAEVVARSWDPGVVVTGGVRAAECDELFRAAK